MFYHKIHQNYGSYFDGFLQPFLFVFGATSVLLSAMQVHLAACETADREQGGYTFAQVSKWFSVVSLVCVVALISILYIVFAMLVLREIVFTGKLVWRNKRKGNVGPSA